MKKTTLITLISLISLFSPLFFPPKASAKRLLPRVAGAKTSATGRSSAPAARSSRGVTVKVSFRDDRKATIATFSNLSIATKVEYSLTYNTRGTKQAVVGSLDPTREDPTMRELLFGTCSAGVCRYDAGISDARFTVTTTLKSGLKVVKPFRLKV